MGRKSTWMYADQLWVNQRGICAWPLCLIRDVPLGMSGNNGGWETGQVDHNHRCCDDERTCGKCVRGLVHRICNNKYIAWADWAIDNGFDPPDGPMKEYLTVGESHCRGEDRLAWGYREPIVPERSLADELELDAMSALQQTR